MTGKHRQMAPSWSPQSLSPPHPISCVPPSSFVYSISWFKPSCLLPLFSLGQTCECAQVVCGNWWACFPSLDSYSSPSNFALKARIEKRGIPPAIVHGLCFPHTIGGAGVVCPSHSYVPPSCFIFLCLIHTTGGRDSRCKPGGGNALSSLCASSSSTFAPFAHFRQGAPIRCCEHHLS